MAKGKSKKVYSEEVVIMIKNLDQQLKTFIKRMESISKKIDNWLSENKTSYY
jgi:hypothetical protein